MISDEMYDGKLGWTIRKIDEVAGEFSGSSGWLSITRDGGLIHGT